MQHPDQVIVPLHGIWIVSYIRVIMFCDGRTFEGTDKLVGRASRRQLRCSGFIQEKIKSGRIFFNLMKRQRSSKTFVCKYLRRYHVKESCHSVLLQSKDITPQIGQNG